MQSGLQLRRQLRVGNHIPIQAYFRESAQRLRDQYLPHELLQLILTGINSNQSTICDTGIVQLGRHSTRGLDVLHSLRAAIRQHNIAQQDVGLELGVVGDIVELVVHDPQDIEAVLVLGVRS